MSCVVRCAGFHFLQQLVFLAKCDRSEKSREWESDILSVLFDWVYSSFSKRLLLND